MASLKGNNRVIIMGPRGGHSKIIYKKLKKKKTIKDEIISKRKENFYFFRLSPQGVFLQEIFVVEHRVPYYLFPKRKQKTKNIFSPL